jgi:hypothetical protein
MLEQLTQQLGNHMLTTKFLGGKAINLPDALRT